MRIQPGFAAPPSASSNLMVRPAVSRNSNWMRPAPYNPKIKVATDIRAKLHMNMANNNKEQNRFQNIGKNIKNGVLAGVVSVGIMTHPAPAIADVQKIDPMV